MERHNKIFKYELDFNGQNPLVVDMPKGAIFLDLQMQDGIPVIWCSIPEGEPELKPAYFYFIFTGQVVDFDLEYEMYRGTIQDNYGLVWHVYYSFTHGK